MTQRHITKLLFAIVTVLAITGFTQIVQAQNQETPASPTSAVPPSTNPASHAIFPAKGQNQELQMKDQLDAYNWATQQAGWDPHKAYDKLVEQGYVTKKTAEQAKGGLLKGAAGGALAGAAIGAIAGDTGKGAAIGAAAGGMGGGMRSRRARKGAQSSQQQTVDEFQRQFANWDKFYVAAMEGKGYSVK